MAQTSSPKPSPTTPRKKKSVAGRLVKVVVAIVVILLIVIALIPTLVSFGVGKGWIENAIAANFNGDVSIDRVKLGWFGEQRIEGLSVKSENGETTANVTASIDKGLLALVRGGNDFGTIAVSGDLAGVRHENGTTSFQSLLKEKVRDPDRERREREERERKAKDAEPFDMRAKIVIDAINIVIDDRALDETIKLSDLKGTIDLNPQAETTVVLAAATTIGATAGKIDIDAVVANLFDNAGAVDASKASVDVTASVAKFPVAIADAVMGMDGRLIALFGTVIETLTLNIDGAMESADGAVMLESDGVNAGGDFLIRDRRFQITTDKPMTVAARVNDDLLAAWMAGASRPTFAGEATSTVTLNIASADIPLPIGREVDLTGGSLEASLAAEPMAFLMKDFEGIDRIDVQRATVTLSAADLTERVSIISDAEAMLNGNQPSTFHAAIDAAQLIQPGGSVTFDPARLTGEVRGAAIPTALANRFAKGTPVRLGRDIGPTVDLAATFSEGEQKTINATATAANLKAELLADVSPARAIQGRKLRIETELKRALVSELTPLAIAYPRTAVLELTEFSVPASDPEKGFDLKMVAATGALRLEGESTTAQPRGAEVGDARQPSATETDAPPADASSPQPPTTRERGGGRRTEQPAATEGAAQDEPQPEQQPQQEQAPRTPRARPLQFAAAQIAFATASLGDGVDLDGSVSAEGANVTIDQRLTNLFDETGSLALAGAIPVGTVTVTDITGRHVALFAPDLEETVDAMLGGPLSVTATTMSPQPTDLRADITLASKSLNGTMGVTRSDQSIGLTKSTITLDVPADVFASLRPADPDAEAPLAIAAKAMKIDIKPATLMTRVDDAWQMSSEPVTAKVTAESASVSNIAGLQKPLTLRTLVADLSAQMGEATSYSAKGSADVRNGETDAPIGRLVFDAGATRASAEEALQPRAQITLNEVNTTNLDPLLGKEEPFVARWLGEKGSLSIDASPLEAGGVQASAVSNFPYLTGEFDLSMSEGIVSIATPKKPTLTLQPATLEGFLNAPPAESESAEAPATPPARITVQNAVPLVLDIKEFIVPQSLMSGEAVDPKSGRIDVALSASSPVVLQRTQEGKPPINATFRKFGVTAKAADLNALSYTVNGVLQTAAGDQSDRAKIDLAGTLKNLIDKDSAFALAGGTLDLNATVSEFPTWVFDVFAGNQSLFSDALGPSLSATVVSSNFSPESGKLTADASSTNGSTVHAELQGRNNAVRTQKDQPVTAKLTFTPELGSKILYQTNPIFEGVRTTGDKVEIIVKDANVPVDDRLRRLNADVEIRIGPIELDSTNQVARFLKFVEASEQESVSGYVHPLNLTIRNGRMTYENFVVELDKRGRREEYRHKLEFAGDINLVTKHVNEIIGLYPVSSLSDSVRELAAVLPDTARLGIEMSGDLYDKNGNPQKLDWKPKLDLGDILKGEEEGGNPLDRIGDIIRDRSGGGGGGQ